MEGPVAFGRGARSLFLLDANYTLFNHGSFGACPKAIRNTLRGFQDRSEAAPDRFLRYDYRELLDQARECVAALVNAPADECVFVPNATAGINTILRNLRYSDKDCIIYFETTYGAIERTLFSLVETNPQLRLHKIEYTLPCSHQEIVEALSQTITQVRAAGLIPKICLFDAIVSVPGIRFPFESLTKLCHRHNVLSVIDGAHTLGQIEVDLAELDADFFVSTCHKWLYVPRGCALLHVPSRNQHLIRTTYPTSWEYSPTELSSEKKSSFANLFAYVGTADNSSYYCIPAAIDFRQSIGGEDAIRRYSCHIAQSGADRLASLLKTEVMGEGHSELRQCALANVRLPMECEDCIESDETMAARAKRMQKVLIQEYHVGLSIFPYKKSFWIRVSGQIYLELSDFEMLAGVLKEVVDRLASGDILAE